MVASSSNKWGLAVLSVDEVNRKVGSSIEEAEYVGKDAFLAVGVDGARFFLFFVEVTECCICGSSGSAVLVDIWEVAWVAAYDEIIDLRFDVGTKVNITRNVGFGGVGI